MSNQILTIAVAAGIPSSLCTFFVWLMQQKLLKMDKSREEHEQQRQELMLTILNSVNASMGLAEATAKAVQRIPDSHCNGDMHEALDYALKVKHDQKKFLTEMGIKTIYE